MPYEGTFSWFRWEAAWDTSGRFIPKGKWDAHPGSIRVHGEKGALRIFPYANKLYFFGEAGDEEIAVFGSALSREFRPSDGIFCQQYCARRGP